MKIVDIIKYEGNNDTFVWKHPAEDFNTMSQLVVHESQEAILFRDGQALDLFGPGRYTLKSQNIPLLRKVVNIPTDGESPFHCEVYFINKTMPLDMKWGTKSQIVVQDPKFNILLHAGANGGLGVQIEDSRKFLVKFVGTTSSFDKDAIINYFRDLIVTRVKTYLTNIMSKVSFVTVNAKLDDMSSAMLDTLSNEMTEFGVKLIKFFVSAIQLDKEDYNRVQIALSEATAVGIAATAEKEKMDILGYNWVDKETTQILKLYAGNEGAQNSVGGAVTQIPLAMLFGQMIKDNSEPMVSNLFSGNSQNISNAADKRFCSNCGKELDIEAKFCSGCGKALAVSNNMCTKCGREFKNDENFCPKCGTKREG